MIGAGKNGPPGKYERWLSSASSGSVGIGCDNRPGELTVACRNRHASSGWRFICTENPWVGDSHSVHYQTFQVQVRNWKVGEVFVKKVGRLVSPRVQVFRCVMRRTRNSSYELEVGEILSLNFEPFLATPVSIASPPVVTSKPSLEDLSLSNRGTKGVIVHSLAISRDLQELGSGVIYYKYEKREKFEDYDMKADAKLGTFKIRRYNFGDEFFVHPLHSVRFDPDRPYEIPIEVLMADQSLSSSKVEKSSTRRSRSSRRPTPHYSPKGMPSTQRIRSSSSTEGTSSSLSS
ncbi:hypothetical protein PIB30_047623 [Stylosanthes scabra]|uniref:Uncharacterized protein n=1 Tax=Stylosanthes scabra TaxID=79078 RepID=A0ABU6SHZ0_9FABA|nr:hypothetical protein [Stylosanthes scabra]